MHPLLAKLAAPFPIEAVSWRIASTNKERNRGMAVCYIDARDVQGRLDAVMGVDWSDEIIVQPSGLVTCRIGLLIDGSWRFRHDGTAAVREVKPQGGDLSPKEDQEREMAQKGAASDAFKRAAVKWGIGRYLYEISSPWVGVDQYRAIAKEDMPKLRAVLEQHYRHWTSAAPQELRPVQQQPAAPQQQRALAPPPQQEVIDDETGEVFLPDDFARDPNWQRIVTLLDKDTRCREDVLAIVNAENNKRAIEAWPEAWKVVMRGKARAALARFPVEHEHAA